MKKLLSILSVLFCLSTSAQDVKGTITVNVPDAVSQKQFADSLNRVKLRIDSIAKVKGLKGDMGLQGIAGVKGKDGLNGKDGAAGQQGIQGVAGKDGINGTNGKDGLKGDQGTQGLQGLQGIQGIQGIPGKDGSGTGIAANIFSLISVKDFGAKGDGNTDDYPAIQRGIDYCILHNIRVLFFPVGNYKISHQLNVTPSSGSMFCTLELRGEGTWWDSNAGTNLYYTATTGCCINIQQGKGCIVRNFRLQGVFQPPATNDYLKFYSTTFNDFNDGICDTNRYHPHAGIAVDYFPNKNGSVSGSTGTIIENNEIKGFYVGFISSANGSTLNAENTYLNRLSFGDVNTWIACCQAQEKGNLASFISGWGTSYQAFSTGQFGAGQGGNWALNHFKFAGANVRCVTINQQGWFSISASDWYGESVGRFGDVWAYRVNVTFEKMHIDFALPQYAGQPLLINAFGRYVAFRDCTFRYYGGNGTDPIQIMGDALYDHCTFDGGVLTIYGHPLIINDPKTPVQ